MDTTCRVVGLFVTRSADPSDQLFIAVAAAVDVVTAVSNAGCTSVLGRLSAAAVLAAAIRSTRYTETEIGYYSFIYIRRE